MGQQLRDKRADVRIDTTPPVSQAVVDSAARTVTLRAADGGSGVARMEYSLTNGSTRQAYTTQLRLGRAESVVLYRAMDAAGNLEPADKTVLPAVGVVLAKSTTSASLVAAKVPYGRSAVVKVKVGGALADCNTADGTNVRLWIQLNNNCQQFKPTL